MTTGLVRRFVESQQDLAKSKGQRFRVKRSPRVAFPKSIERDYQAYVSGLVKAVADDVRDLLFPLLPAMARAAGQRGDAMTRFNPEDITATMDGVMGEVTARLNNRHLRGLEDAVQGYQRATSLKVLEQLRRQVRGMISLDAFPPDSDVQRKLLDSWVETNRKRIKALTTAQVEEVEDIAQRGFQAGDRASVIEKQILERFPVVQSRAQLIARDQLNKLRGNLTRVRQTSLGIDRYIWRTSRDERVRESHLVKEGKVFEWSKPPPDTGHPGQGIQCRCTAEPYIEGVDEEEDTTEVIAEVREKRERLKAAAREKAAQRRARIVATQQRQLAKRSPFRRSKNPERPADPDRAAIFDAVDSWVHGSRSRSAVMMKRAAKKAFRLQGVAFTSKAWTIADTEVSRAVPAIRRMYRATQAALKRRGVKTLRLYRGIKEDYTVGGALESWTTDLKTAKKFAGPRGKVIVEDVPVARILNGVDMEHWHNGRFGNQSEWIVMQ